MTLRELAEYLTQQGYKTAHITLVKATMPSRNEGPPCEGWWGHRRLYDPAKALKWARARVSKQKGEPKDMCAQSAQERAQSAQRREQQNKAELAKPRKDGKLADGLHQGDRRKERAAAAVTNK
jgi:hypothetical protein